MEHATILPNPDFNCEECCKKLRKSMRGIGTDERMIISVLTKQCRSQRLEIRSMYKTMYGVDLEDAFKEELSGFFLTVCLDLLKDLRDYEAEWLYKAVDGAGTNEKALMEILCSRDGIEINEIKAAYQKQYKKNFEDILENEGKGEVMRLFRALATGGRPADNTEVDEEMTKKDAQELYDAGEGKLGTDEDEINRVLASRSRPHLLATFEEYYKIAEKDIMDSLLDETSGNLKKMYRLLVENARNRQQLFARLLNNAMDGPGTDDDTLVRLLITRSEIDLVKVKSEYVSLFNRTLYDDVKDDTGGDYRKILLGIVGQ
ncbi:hypothetical protein SNEBB_001117 [Seison nebaliae]|nr:hypothetical protein SNEBB_001117 [Seison nebaliae]